MNPPEEEEQCCVVYCVDLLYEHFSLHVSDIKASIVGLFMLKTVGVRKCAQFARLGHFPSLWIVAAVTFFCFRFKVAMLCDPIFHCFYPLPSGPNISFH